MIKSLPLLLTYLRTPVATKMGALPRLLLSTPEGWCLNHGGDTVAPSVALEAIAAGRVKMTNPPDKSSWSAV